MPEIATTDIPERHVETVPELVDDIRDALQIGKMLRNPEMWSDLAYTRGVIAHVLIILGGIMDSFPAVFPHLGATDATTLAGGISVGVGLYLSWRSQRLHRASNPYAR